MKTICTRQGNVIPAKLTPQMAASIRYEFVCGSWMVRTVPAWRLAYRQLLTRGQNGRAVSLPSLARSVRKWLDVNPTQDCAYVVHSDDSITRYCVDMAGVLRASSCK